MCYCVFLASDHPFPVIPLVRDQRAFNAEPLQESVLVGEPDFQKDYSLEEGLYIYYDKRQGE